MTRSEANPANAAPRTAQTASKHPARARRGIRAHEGVTAHEAVATADVETTKNLERTCEAAEQAGNPTARKPWAKAQVPALADQPAPSAADDATGAKEVAAAATRTPAAAPPSTSPTAAAPASTSKLARLIAVLRQPEGATIDAMGQATGWQPHSVRGAMAGALKRKGLVVVSVKPEGGARRYRIRDDA